MALDDILTHLLAVLLLIMIQQSWFHFGADFPHAQIIRVNLPKTVLFLCLVDLWLFEHHISLALYARLWVLSCLLKTSRICSHLYSPLNLLWTSCTTQKMWHGVISMNFLKPFKCLWRNILQPKQKFQIYSLFSVHLRSSVLIAERFEKGGVNKRIWKNAMVSESQD